MNGLRPLEKNMYTHLEDDWLTRRIDTLRPGWRGRLHLRAPEESKLEAHEDIVGTVVDEISLDHDDDGALVDATITFCTNYRNGKFVRESSEPRLTLRVSRIDAMEAM